MANWTKEWPQEPGWYWIYRLPWKSEKWILETCRVHQGANSIVYVAGAQFLYKSEQDTVYWKPMEVPDVPEV